MTLGTVTKYGFTGLIALIGLASLLAPSQAEASIFGTLTSFFSTPAVASAGVAELNSQKMPLLEAPVGPMGMLNQKSTASIIEAHALVAQAAPSTTGSETLSNSKDQPDVLILKPTGQSNKVTTYTVAPGDTIGEIAEKFGVSTNTILWANNLRRDSKITVGQRLVILPVTGVQYKVISGDTLQKIALKYKTDASDIADYNDISAEKIRVGDILVIPGAEPTSSAPTSIAVVAQPKTSTVQKLASAALGVNKASANVAESTGYFVRPINGGTRTQGIHGSNAVDLAASCGTTIYAAAGGVVTISSGNGAWAGGYGNYVVIDHNNGSQTLYSHMQDVHVAEGSPVAQGDAIGTIGATGKVHGATGCHVHFEIRNGGRNPF